MKSIAVIIDTWDKPSLINKIFWFGDHSFNLHKRIIKFIESRKEIDTIIIASYDEREVSKYIKFWKPKQPIYYMLEREEIEKILISNDIEKIFICGEAFEKCVRDRPIGYVNIKKIIDSHKLKTRIFVNPDCVLPLNRGMTLNGTKYDPKNYPDWKETEEKDIYEFKPI